MKRKVLSVLLITSMLLAGCGNQSSTSDKISGMLNSVEKSDSGTNDKNEVANVEVAAAGETFTVKDLKQTYGAVETQQIKPFYNVEQTTKFVFHFNSNVEPCYAITVHTDPKCEESSLVYQINDGYKSDSGVDVVVKPGSPVLNYANSLENYNWGNAPIYYICIRYDMDATTPAALATPIVIPFTLKSPVSVPTVVADIDSNGVFSIKWNPVDGASKYNIYQANRVRSESPAYDMTRAEAGYVGDHLELLATVDGSTTSFADFHVDGTDNKQLDSDGFVSSQNFYDLGSYYVTAVNSSGKESLYSFPVTGWSYASQLPENIDISKAFMRDSSGNIASLPDTVPVKMVDGSISSLPVDYERVSEVDGSAVYKYRVRGTCLCGYVTYVSASGEYPETITSTIQTPNGLYDIDNNIVIVPANDVATIIDERYADSDVDLSGNINLDESKKIEYSSDMLVKRADIENARLVQDGIYTTSLQSSIPSYVSDMTYKVGEGGSSTTQQSTDVQEKEPEKTKVEKSEVQSEQKNESSDGNSLDLADNGKITSDNLVEVQKESTEREVAEADKETMVQAGYPIFADSAEEAYLAQKMINVEHSICLDAFPKLQDGQYLADVLVKVVYQNPYIVTVSGTDFDVNTHSLILEYAIDDAGIKQRQAEANEEVKKIVSEIITPDMSDEDKIAAIWKYFEENTAYDMAACEAADANNWQLPSGHEDAFNLYGILCDKVGVCQSYAYAMKLLCNEVGIDCINLLGYCSKTLPHAWNAVNLGGQYYWIDVTNNMNNAGIPYLMYQTSSDFAELADYALDDRYELDTNLDIALNPDNTKDWYYQNGLAAGSDDDLVNIFVDRWKNASSGQVIAVKYNYDIDMSDEGSLFKIVVALAQEGLITEEDFYNLKGGISSGLVVLIKP